MAYYTPSPGAGYTQRIITWWGNIVEDQFVTMPGTYDATAPQSASYGWIMQIATFK